MWGEHVIKRNLSAVVHPKDFTDGDNLCVILAIRFVFAGAASFLTVNELANSTGLHLLCDSLAC